MKTIISFFLFTLILFPLKINSQEPELDLSDYRFGVGAAAGFSTGYGLSFRYWPGNWGIQLTTAPYYTPDDATISFGATALRSLTYDRKVDLFLYIGNHLLYESYTDYWDNGDHQQYLTWIIGAGPGFEFTIFDRASFNVMFGIASYFDGELMINMTVETGLYYTF